MWCSYYTIEPKTYLNIMSKNTERLVIEINADLKRRFKERVEKQGGTMRYFLLKWIKDFTYDSKTIKK